MILFFPKQGDRMKSGLLTNDLLKSLNQAYGALTLGSAKFMYSFDDS